MKKQEFIIGVKTDIGNKKNINQDSFLCKTGNLNGSDFGLFLVCDGIGGLSKGEIASNKVVKSFDEWWKTNLKKIMIESSDIFNDIKKSLEDTMYKANNKIIQYSQENNIQLGTTATLIFIMDGRYYIAHIGDSRVYEVRKNINQLTEDHTHYAKLIKEGKFEEAKKVKKSVLVQCIGIKSNINLYISEGYINKDTNFLICSDGFYNKMNESKIKKIFKSRKVKEYYMQEKCEELVEEVKSKRERDNITLIALKVNLKRKSLINYIKDIFIKRR